MLMVPALRFTRAQSRRSAHAAQQAVSVSRGYSAAVRVAVVAPRCGGSPIARLSGGARRSLATSSIVSSADTKSNAQFTGLRFAEMPIHADTKRAVAEVLGYEHATKVQTESLPPCLAGSDVLAKAKTGTGKTLAFLVPVIEKLASVPLNQRRGEISALIISPTRELAMQIEKELKQLCTFHDQTGLVRNTLVAVGGQKVGKNVAALRQTDRLPDIVVATPGRLFDLLENYGLAKQMTKLKILVFDEADMLFEMGFMNDIRKIMAKLPPKATRQTISFSATMPRDVETLAKTVMRADDFEFVDTVGEEDNTHAHIAQQFTVCPFGEEATVLLHNLQAEMDSNPNFKGVVFFNTAALTKYYAQLFNKIGLDVLEMHSRKSQSQREKVSAEFKKRSRCFLFTSDVSARGMDYPDVSGVFQVGAPAETAKYVHRLGRTGRAGLGGHGMLILGEPEKFFLDSVHDLPLEEVPYHHDANAAAGLERGLAMTQPRDSVPQAYQSWLGYYKVHMKRMGWQARDLVAHANIWALRQGLSQPPPVKAVTAGRMGLRGVPGLNISGRGDSSDGRRAGGGGGGGSGGGGGGRRRH